MNGNVTREGITADLEAMKRVGIGGAQIFNVGENIPAGPVKFMSPEWRAMIGHAAQEADRLGIELCIHNCAGWSSSGGPWNAPSNAMQRVTTSEVRVTGPKHLAQALPQPPTKLDFYRDIAVFAFRTPDGEGADLKALKPKVTASVPDVDGAKLLGAKGSAGVTLPAPVRDKPQFVQFEFSQPFTSRTIVLNPGPGMGEVKGAIQVSDDGQKFRELRSFSFPRSATQPVGLSLGDESISAHCYRIVFSSAAKTAKTITLGGVDLSPRLRIENFEAKCGSNGGFVSASPAENSAAPSLVVQREKMIDLTTKLGSGGQLEWDVPAGDWTILRLGYTPTGKDNHPAPPEGTGPECDKFSKEALDAHWAGMMQAALETAGPLAGKSLNNALIDSYEVGGQNWTPKFREEFKRRRGYDPLPWLPTFTGRVVDNPEASERFLWDVRRTIADLFAENYYGHFQELCHQHGLQASIEPYTGPFESLQCGEPADIPMGEFWVGGTPNSSVKLAASVGHIYGRPVIGAESFTAAPGAQHGRWLDDAYSLKALGDQVFCLGVNRYILHRYAMQPWTNRWPGMTMGQWGTHFDRTSTWWEQSKAWIQYVARCQFLLQQGRFVADAAYFCGENAPVEMPTGNPSLPPGYDYDGVNATVLDSATVQNGQLVLKSGMRYRVLILQPNDRNLTPGLLRTMRGLVAAGLTLVGAPPLASPSLQNYPKCDAEVQKLVAEMWGNCDGKTITEHTLGNGKVIWGQPLAQVFAALNEPPDFEFSPGKGSRLLFIHRVDGDAQVYFVSNQRERFNDAECSFRVTGMRPELWDPMTGRVQPAPVWREEGGRTVVPLSFDPAGSVFVVFRQPAGAADHFVSVTESVVRPAATPAPKLEIRHARYEATDGTGGADVTAKVAALVDGGALRVEANNDLFGDPVVNHVKQLRVEYVLGGKSGERVVGENEVMTLGAAAAMGEAPAFELRGGVDGTVTIAASAPGHIEFKTAGGKTVRKDFSSVPSPTAISGEWQLNFPPMWGAPEQVTLSKLISWPEHEDKGVKYFSGTATYTKGIEIPAELLAFSRELWLDLGRVKNFAEVSLNGKPLGILWKPPFRVEITGAARSGTNMLEVKVTNLWPNRLIGDEQLPPDCEWNGKPLKAWPQWLLDGKPSPTGRFTFTTWHHWTKDEPLLESGLLGPVRLITAERLSVVMPP